MNGLNRKSGICFAFGTTLLLLLVSLGVSSQSEPPPGWGTLSWYKSTAETVLANARRMIEPVLTADELAVARSISYNVTAQPGIGAFADWQGGRRVVIISAGMVQTMEFLSEAIIFDEELGSHGCYAEYSKYAGERIIENTRRKADGLSPLIMVNVFGFSKQTRGACTEINVRAFRSRPDLGSYRAGMIEASIIFLYLHELAHHVLGHTDGMHLRPGECLDPCLAMHRSQEDAADRWAITHALKAHYNLVAAMPIFSFIALLGGNSIESEVKMDHPLGLRRVLALFDEVSEFYRQHPDQWTGRPSLATFINDMEKNKTEFNAHIASLSRIESSDSGAQTQASRGAVSALSPHGGTACRNQCKTVRDQCVEECGPGPDHDRNPNWLYCRRNCRAQAQPCRDACSAE